jgi:hypothetical protein
MGAKKYAPTMNIAYSNAKTEGVDICNADTCRGCNNRCESCYQRISSRKSDLFFIPVPIHRFTGKVDQNIWYRFGNAGDPAYDWVNSERLIKKYNFEKFFAVTKLQNIEGFTGVFEKMQVSVDIFNVTHMLITLQNIEYILNNFYEVKVVLRVRSCSTTDQELLDRMAHAVAFANEHHLPILETRIRFLHYREAIKKYSLIVEDYRPVKSSDMFMRPIHNKSFLKEVDRYYACDFSGNKCKGCKNCLTIWNKGFDENEFDVLDFIYDLDIVSP